MEIVFIRRNLESSTTVFDAHVINYIHMVKPVPTW